MSLQHVVAIVTGAASGLGRATSTRLVQQGVRVVLCDLPDSAGPAIAEELGPNARFAPADVVNEQEVAAALDLAEAVFGQPVNVAVNHAGILARASTVDENLAPHPSEIFERVLQVNTLGTFRVARLSAARMATRTPTDDGERGVIINTSSIAAYEGMIGRVAYAASKAAIVGMTMPMARDLGHLGIRVISIAPGGFRTAMSGPEHAEAKAIGSFAFPKRLGDPSEVAHLVQAIIENPMLNGETIRLDAGARLPQSLL